LTVIVFIYCCTDVLDLAWAPGDIWLATCSIDNTIIVWNADKLPGMIYARKL